MNFQEKLFETTAALGARAATRVEALKGRVSALTVAGREFNKVARRHAVRFVKENSTIAVEAGKDVSALVRTTLTTLATKQPVQKTRKASISRKRVARKVS